MSDDPQILYVAIDSRLLEEPEWFTEAFERDGLVLVEADDLADEDEATALAPNARALLVNTGRYQVTARSLSRLDNCGLVLRMGAGYDNIDVQEATRRGVIVANMPANLAEEVSDHAIALFFACLRHLGEQTSAIRAGRWEPYLSYPTKRLRGQTLGLVGFGRIARKVAEKLSGFGLNCITHDPYVDQDTAGSHQVEVVSLDELLERSDVISIHAPATEDSRGMFDATTLAKMKPSAILINTARGSLIDEAALADALRNKRLLAAGLDVFVDEPVNPDNPLLKLDNVILTPHVAGYSEEGLVDYYETAHRLAAGFVLHGRVPDSILNPEVLSR